MRQIISNIKNKDYDAANANIAEAFKLILEKKLWERRKAVGAKMCEQPMTRAKKLAADVLEEDGESTLSRVGRAVMKGVAPVIAGASPLAAGIVAASTTSANKGEPDYVKQNVAAQKAKDEKLHEEETLDEARIKIIKARVRGGKIQRRKKVSNVPGYRLQGGQLQRMSPAERRRRKLGAKRAKIKRKSKMARALVKRQRSLRRRATLGV